VREKYSWSSGAKHLYRILTDHYEKNDWPMILFSELEARKEELRLQFLVAKPFPHLAIDGFCDETELSALLHEMPEIVTKSRDYVFGSQQV
jgi:hypothetical protein